MVKDRESNLQNIGDDDEDELDEEPGEVIESAPPLKLGEEREFSSSGIKKKLLKRGIGWESPEFGDEVTGNVALSELLSLFVCIFLGENLFV